MPKGNKPGGGLKSSPAYKKKSPLYKGIGSYKGEGNFTMKGWSAFTKKEKADSKLEPKPKPELIETPDDWSFDEAFAFGKRHAKTFRWRGKKYNTETKE